MLNKVKNIEGYKLICLDGEIGEVKEFFFDDHHWTIRYLVVNTGSWLESRQVLITPHAVCAINAEKKFFTINLTRKQIEDSPILENDMPISQQFEEAYYAYYQYPMYWSGSSMWGAYPNIVRDYESWRTSSKVGKAWDPHLLSTNDVNGQVIQATDGEVGCVHDFVIDDETWAIRYLVVDTGNWWPGKKVLVSPQWIDRVSWSESKVYVNLLCEDIKKSPEYNEESLLTREYEAGLHQHYNRQGYWVSEWVEHSC